MRFKTWTALLLILTGLLYGCGKGNKKSLPPYPVTTVSPPPGTYPQSYPLAVTLTTDRPATIYYTLDGSTPEIGRGNTLKGESPVEGIKISHDTTIRFFAVDEKGNREAVKTAEYLIDLPPVVEANPPGGGYNSPQTVEISCNEPCEIYYTLDGRTPTETDYDGYGADSVSVQINYDTILKFFAKDHATFTNYETGEEISMPNVSDVVTEEYIIDTTPPSLTISPEGGWYSEPVVVTITASEDAKIYYTLDGSEPSDDPSQSVSAGGSTYQADTVTTISIDDHTVLKAFCVDKVGNRSPDYEEKYRIGPAPMVFVSPLPGLYNQNPLSVEVTTDPPSAYISYTLNGADPLFPNPPSCATPCTISLTTEGINVLKIMASDGTHNDKVREFRYEIDSIPPTTQADPPGGTFTEPVYLKLTANENNCTVYYTLDGTEPSPSNSSTLSAPSPVTNIYIAKDTTVKFYSVDEAGNKETTKTISFQIYGSFTEDFNDTTYMDSVNTDAVWDVAKGTLHLPRGEPEEVGNILLSGGIVDMAVYGDTLIVSTGGAGIDFVNIADPSSPSLVYHYTPSVTESTMAGMIIRDNHLYVANAFGFSIFNIEGIRTGTPPVKEGGYFIIQNPNQGEIGWDAFVLNNALLLCDGTSGLLSYDIRYPSNITQKDLLPAAPVGGDFRRIDVSGNYAYIAANQGNLVIVDISNPFNLSQTSGSPIPISGNSVVVRTNGTYLFVGTDVGEIRVFDITDPQNPSDPGGTETTITLPSPTAVNDILFDGDYLYVAQGALRIIDISNLTNPEVIKTVQGIGTVSSLALYGKYLIAGTTDGTLRIFNIYKPQVPSQEDSVSLIPYHSEIKYPYILIGTENNISIIRYKKGSLTFVNSITGAATLHLKTDGEYLYAVTSSALLVYDIKDLSSPSLLTSVSITDGRAVDVEGDIMAIADGVDGVKIYDISSPTAPSLLSTFTLPSPYSGDAEWVEVDGNLLFTGFGDAGIWILEVKNPSSPSVISNYDTAGSTLHLYHLGDMLLNADAFNGVNILDISNINTPSIVSNISTTNAQFLSVFGNEVFIADGSGGISIADITFPDSPIISAQIPQTFTREVKILGQRLIALDSSEGIKLFRRYTSSASYLSPKKATSLEIDSTDLNIVKAKIIPNPVFQEYGEITFQLSNDGGQTWEDVQPNQEHVFSSQGNALKWRAFLSTDDPDHTPYLESLKIIYRYAQ